MTNPEFDQPWDRIDDDRDLQDLEDRREAAMHSGDLADAMGLPSTHMSRLDPVRDGGNRARRPLHVTQDERRAQNDLYGVRSGKVHVAPADAADTLRVRVRREFAARRALGCCCDPERCDLDECPADTPKAAA